jgi:hypothetical protein
MQSHQLKIDAFCRPVTPAKNEQPAQQALSDNQISLPVPSRRRPRIVDSDSDEGRVVMPTPAERKDSLPISSSALQAPAVTSTPPTQQTTTKKGGTGSRGHTVSRTIHTETVTQVRIVDSKYSHACQMTKYSRQDNRFEKLLKSTHSNKMRKNLTATAVSLMMATRKKVVPKPQIWSQQK